MFKDDKNNFSNVKDSSKFEKLNDSKSTGKSDISEMFKDFKGTKKGSNSDSKGSDSKGIFPQKKNEYLSDVAKKKLKDDAKSPYKMKKGHENEKTYTDPDDPSKNNYEMKSFKDRHFDKARYKIYKSMNPKGVEIVIGTKIPAYETARPFLVKTAEGLNKKKVGTPATDKQNSNLSQNQGQINFKENKKLSGKIKIKQLTFFVTLISSIGCFSVIVIGLILFIIIIIASTLASGLFDNGSDSISFIYDSACNFEETNVIVMDGNNKSVLATVSLEDYVIGVACPEIGACSGEIEKMNKEYLKAKYVAVKTYTLTRRNGYSSSNKSVTMKAATKDQQWCDLDKGCILTKTSHKVEGSNSVYLYSYPGDYNKDKVDGNVYSTLKFTDKDKELAHKYYQEIYGDLFLPTTYNKSIDTLRGESVILSYHDHTQNFWKQQAENGKMYDEILTSTATSGDSDAKHYKGKSIYKMGAYCQASSSGDTGNLVDLGDYPSVFSKKEIRSPITSLLSSSQINEINNYIKTNVDSAGYGTGAGVAAAGQSLIAGLYQKGYFLPYYYGGGHGTGALSIGVDERWGKSVSATDMNAVKGRNVYSYDCSGFVAWSIKNACKSSFSAPKSDQFKSDYGPGISLSKAKPGDLMAKNGHVRLIVKNNGDGSVITAESTSGGYKHGGIQFTKRTEAGPYKVVDMSGWYSRNCSKSR